MTDLAVQKSLLAVTKLKTRNGETAEEFTRRVWQRCQALGDEDWQSLGESAQAWVNDYTVKNENKAPLPVLALPEIEAQAAKEQAQAVEQQDQQESVEVAKSAKSNGESKKPKAEAKPKAPKEVKAKEAGSKGRPKKLEVELPAAAELKPARPGTKTAILLELLSRPEGATFIELHSAMTSFKGRKPWAESTTRAALRADVHVKGYGIKTQMVPVADLKAQKRKVSEKESEPVYHLVLPKGVKAPLIEEPRAAAAA